MKFKDALYKTVEHLKSSEFKSNIYDEDPLMVKYIPIITDINRCGFLTTESHAGHKDSSKIYTIIERAYIAGFMEEGEAEKFIKNMALYTDKNAMFIPICNSETVLPSKLDIPLTITKTNKEIKINTHMSSALPLQVFDFYKKMKKINKSEKVVYLFCWDSQWNRNASSKNGLFTNVLNVLKRL